jgi:hypothetical protein
MTDVGPLVVGTSPGVRLHLSPRFCSAIRDQLVGQAHARGDMSEHAAQPLGRGASLFLGRFSGVSCLGHDLRIPARRHGSET